MHNTFDLINLDRKKYTVAMADNLAMLRAKLGLNQEELAQIIGVTRQTISAIENKSRELTWTNFLSLMFFFTQNEKTRDLLPVLGIYTKELAQFFSYVDLKKLQP